MTARFPRIRTLLAILFVLLVAIACGGSSSVTLTLVADTSNLPPDSDAAAVIQQTADILLARAEIFDAGDAEVTVDGDTITAILSGVDREVAQLLLIPQGQLEFRQPIVDDLGFIICIDQTTGEEFVVHPLRLNADPATGNPARCFGEDQFGAPLWTATSTIFLVLDEFSLHQLIEPSGWRIENNSTLVPTFTSDGAQLLAETTTALSGYPLGVFIDELLVGAPRIQRPITDGEPFISGFSSFQARLYHAQLNADPLPLPLTEATSAGTR